MVDRLKIERLSLIVTDGMDRWARDGERVFTEAVNIKSGRSLDDQNDMSCTTTQTDGDDSPVQGVVAQEIQEPGTAERRRRSRIQCEGLSCTMGRVIGLSGSGMRVRARGFCKVKPDDRVSMTLFHCGGTLPVVARIAWTRKTGFFTYECGMAFEGLTPEQNAELVRLAQISMPRTMLRQGLVLDLPTQ